MIEAFIVIITLCGQPTYIMGNGIAGPVAGPFEWAQSVPEVKEQVQALADEDPLVHIQEWAEVVGAQCS